MKKYCKTSSILNRTYLGRARTCRNSYAGFIPPIFFSFFFIHQKKKKKLNYYSPCLVVRKHSFVLRRRTQRGTFRCWLLSGICSLNCHREQSAHLYKVGEFIFLWSCCYIGLNARVGDGIVGVPWRLLWRLPFIVCCSLTKTVSVTVDHERDRSVSILFFPEKLSVLLELIKRAWIICNLVF